MSEVTHGDSLRVGLGDHAAALQVEVPDAACHRQTPVDVGLADAVPGHEAAAALDPERRHSNEHTTVADHSGFERQRGHSPVWGGGGARSRGTLHGTQRLCNTEAAGSGAAEAGVDSDIPKGPFTSWLLCPGPVLPSHSRQPMQACF